MFRQTNLLMGVASSSISAGACLATGGGAAQTNATLPLANTASSPPLPAGSAPAHSLNTSRAEGPSELHKAVTSPSPALLPQFRPLHPNDTATGATNLGATGQASGDPRIIWRPPVSPLPKVMTEEEAHRLAEAEGISLILAPRNASGYKGVSRNNKSEMSPKSGYCAQFCQHGRTYRLGSFSSAPEAALAYARHLKAVKAMDRRQQEEFIMRGPPFQGRTGLPAPPPGASQPPRQHAPHFWG